MADNLIFPIQFDLEKAVNDAGQQWDKKYAKKLEDYINKRPIKVKLDFESLTDVKTRLAQLKIEPITPETKAAIKELARELQVLAKALEQVKKYSGGVSPDAVRAARINEINQRSADKAAIAHEQARAAAARAEQAEIRLAQARDRNTKSVKSLTAAYKEQSTYLGNLLKRMVAYWGLRQIREFVTNVREVTAQFELQRVSLGAIIQDQERANRLFSEIKTFALKSPVSVMDLTKYTKQIAAYGVETEKLFDTTKMLTDVSVGLGTPLSQLALAFGQIRSSSVLRLAETRQLTEAGIPALELLAKQLEKTYGRFVSTAEVMELISKRAISFEMVEQMFKDMTSAGGMFYQMQEKQGNTLFGMWAKLGDAASVMYDEIGNTESVNSGMKASIALLTTLMKNWKLVGGEMMIVAATMGVISAKSKAHATATALQAAALNKVRTAGIAYNAILAQEAKLATSATIAQKASIAARKANAKAALDAAITERTAANATNVWTRSMNKLKAAFMGNWVTILIAAIAAMGVAIYNAVGKANRLKNTLNSIEAERITQTAQSVRNFEYLADAAVKAADGSKEQKDALDELQRTYSDMIPVQDLTIEKLRALHGNYQSLTTAIKEYIAEQQKRKKLSAIEEEYGNEITDKYKKLSETLIKGVNINVGGSKMTSWVHLQFSAEEFERAINELEKRATDKTKSLRQKLKESFEAIGYDLSKDQISALLKVGKSGVFGGGYFVSLNNALEEQAERIEAVQKASAKSVGDLGRYKDTLDSITESVKKYRLANTKGEAVGRDTFLFQQGQQNFQIKKWADSIKSELEGAGVTIQEGIFNLVDKINENDPTKISTIDFSKLMPMLDSPEVKQKLGNSYETFKDYVLSIQKLYDGIVPSDPIVQAVRNSMFAIGNATKGGMDVMKKYLWDGKTSIEEHLKTLKASSDTLQAELYKYANYIKQYGILGKAALLLRGIDYDALAAEYDALTKQIEYVQTYVKEKDSNKSRSGSKSDTRLQVLQEVAQTLATINKEYDDLAKKEGASKALADIKERFKEVLAYTNKIGGKFGLNFGFPTEFKTLQEYRNAILKVMQSLKGLPEGSEKTILDFKTMIGKADSDYLQKQIEAELKRLSDRISRTKTAKEFYEKILSQTGDVELAANVSLQIYGSTGKELSEQVKEQFRLAFATLDKPDVELSAKIGDLIDKGRYEELRDYIALLPEAQREAAEDLVKAQQQMSVKQYEQWLKDLEKAKDYADKRIELSRYTANQIAEIEAKRDSLNPNDKGYGRDKAMYDRMIKDYREREKNEGAKLDYEQIKEQIGMFDDIGIRLSESFKRILEQLREYTQSSEFARLGQEAQKNVYEQIDKIEDRIREGFQGIGVGSVSTLVRDYSFAASQYLNAQEELKNATFAAIEADRNLTAVKNTGNEEAIKAAEAEKALADARVQSAAATVNAASTDLMRTQHNANRASKQFEGNLERIGNSIRSLNNGALKPLWDMLGPKAHRKIGELLSGGSKLIKAAEKLQKAIDETEGGLGGFSESITEKILKATQDIDPEDIEAITEATNNTLVEAFKGIGFGEDIARYMADTMTKTVVAELASKATADAISGAVGQSTEALIQALAKGGQSSGNLWGAIIGLILQLLDEFAENGVGEFIKTLLEDVGDAVNGILSELLETTIPGILEGVGELVQQVAYGIVNLLTFSAFDLGGRKAMKKANKCIEEQDKILKDLEYRYDRLGKIAEKVFGSDYIDNYNQQLKNLQAQQEAYLKQAEAEKSKGKKEDEEKTQEYLDKARDIGDQIADMQEDLIEHFTGSSRTDIARQMAQSWIDARASMSDTFAAIKGDYQDLVKNMLVETMAAKIIENAFSQVWKDVDERLKDNDVEGAVNAFMNGMDTALTNADDGMEVWWKAMEARGFDMKNMFSDMDSEYTGIAKSVAGATSEEINNVAAIGNTLMYYVSPIPRMDENLARVVALMEGRGAALPTASGATTGAVDYTEMFTTANQHLSSLPRMEQHLAEIHTMLGRALRTKGSTTGFNTFLNS